MVGVERHGIGGGTAIPGTAQEFAKTAFQKAERRSQVASFAPFTLRLRRAAACARRLTKWGLAPQRVCVESPVHEYAVLIIERHLDTFGHVNNATYLELFEAARWDWITSNGFGIERIRELQQGPTIVEVTLRFKREIKNRQRILIRSWALSYEGKICNVIQEMRDEANELYCDARFVCGLFDMRARRLLAPTPDWLRAIGMNPKTA